MKTKTINTEAVLPQVTVEKLKELGWEETDAIGFYNYTSSSEYDLLLWAHRDNTYGLELHVNSSCFDDMPLSQNIDKNLEDIKGIIKQTEKILEEAVNK